VLCQRTFSTVFRVVIFTQLNCAVKPRVSGALHTGILRNLLPDYTKSVFGLFLLFISPLFILTSSVFKFIGYCTYGTSSQIFKL